MLVSLRTRSRSAPYGSSFVALLLTSCLFLFSACTGDNTARTNRLTSTHRTIATTSVSSLLKMQGQMQLQTFQHWVALMQRYKGAVGPYEQELTGDQHALGSARTDSAYQMALHTLDQQVKNIQMPALKVEARSLERQLAQQSYAWGQHHTFHDSYNGTTYQLGYEYGPNGVDSWIQDEITGAQRSADYQQAIEDADAFLTNFRAYQTNFSDKTPWSRFHTTDLQLLQHYQALKQKVIVVSLGEQALRVYNHGELVKAFQVTTGRPEKPSLPGVWSVESKQSPTVFKSDEPRGSPYWYPDTPIHYAMLYHSGGYFIHDSWWRADYGPDTQFPHMDSSGDSFSFDGSHGCVNISTPNAAWLYNYVEVNTRVIIY